MLRLAISRRSATIAVGPSREYYGAMRDERKWQLAVAEFKATRANVPGLISEAFVNEFHAVLDRMVAASEEDFDTFRIAAADLKPRVVSSQRRSHRGHPGRTQYSREKFCDRNLFQRKIDGLAAYLPIVEEKTREPLVSEDSKDYWLMDDAKLVGLADKFQIGGYGDQFGFVDRSIIINALLQRDRAMLPQKPTGSHFNNLGTIIDSNVLQDSHRSNAIVNAPVHARSRLKSQTGEAIPRLALTSAQTESPAPGVSEKKAMPKKVFISYSHDSDAHGNRVLELSNRLREDGVDCHIDLYEESPPEGWPRWCDRQVREADFVLVACTQTYLRRFRGEEEQGKGLGGTWEGHIITQELYNAQGTNTKFLPILFAEKDKEFIPNPLQGATHYELSEQYEDLYRRLTGQPKIIRPALGELRSMPPKQMAALPELKPRKSFFALPDAKFSHEETIRSGGEHLYNQLIAENFISHSAAGSAKVRELIEEIARHSTQPIPIESITATFGEQRAARGRTFFGNPGDCLEQILGNQPGVRWWISSHGLNVHAETADGDVSDGSQKRTEPKSLAMCDEIPSPGADRRTNDGLEQRELVACAEYETKGPGAEFVKVFVRRSSWMKGGFVLIDGKNEHEGTMEDVGSRYLMCDRYLTSKGFVRMRWRNPSNLASFEL